MHEPHRPRRFEPPYPHAWQVIVSTAWQDVQTSPHIRRSYETAWDAICRFLDAEYVGSHQRRRHCLDRQPNGDGGPGLAADPFLATPASLYNHFAQMAPALLIRNVRPVAVQICSAAQGSALGLAYLPISDPARQKTRAVQGTLGASH